MQILRTPDERFDSLEDYPFKPHYTDVDAGDGSTTLRIHHIDEGPSDGPIVLCMHGQPVWSYLYRKMIPFLTAAGLRVIAPDLVGYGKSDKPAAREDYSYERQVTWMGRWLEANDFRGITFFGQDWGGLIGLRMIVNDADRFEAIAISNTGLPYNPDVSESVVASVENFRANAPTPTLVGMSMALQQMSGGLAAEKFAYWQKFCWETEDLPIGLMLSLSTERQSNIVRAIKIMLHRMGKRSPLPSAVSRGYDAPFPDPSFMMGPRAMPSQVPTLPTSPSLEAQRQAWEFYAKWEKPFVCAFADNDPVTAGGEAAFLDTVPGTKRQPHTTIKGAGHFVQEMAPKQVSQVIIDLVRTQSSSLQK